jgi:hypothetical protein
MAWRSGRTYGVFADFMTTIFNMARLHWFLLLASSSLLVSDTTMFEFFLSVVGIIAKARIDFSCIPALLKYAFQKC